MYSRIDSDAWKTIEIVIRTYPENKRKMEEYARDVAETKGNYGFSMGIQEDYSKPQSCTESKALRLASSEYYRQLKKEVEGVELAYNALTETGRRIIRIRFWSKRKKVPYLKIENTGYSERQMKRIVYHMIENVGRYIGKIE